MPKATFINKGHHNSKNSTFNTKNTRARKICLRKNSDKLPEDQKLLMSDFGFIFTQYLYDTKNFSFLPAAFFFAEIGKLIRALTWSCSSFQRLWSTNKVIFQVNSAQQFTQKGTFSKK